MGHLCCLDGWGLAVAGPSRNVPVGSLTCPPTTHVTLRNRPPLGDLLMAGTTCGSSMTCRHVSDDYVSSGTVSWLPGGQWLFSPVGGPWTSSFTRACPLPEGGQSCMQLHMQYPYVEPQMHSKHYATTRWLACLQLQLHMQYQHVEPQMHVQYPGTRKILYGNVALPQSVPQLWTGQPMRTHRVTAEQGLTRHSHALRHFEHLDDWLWRRCTILKRYGRYRLSTCIGCQWLPIRPEILNMYIRRPVRDTTPASDQQGTATHVKPFSARRTTKGRPRPNSGGTGRGPRRGLLPLLLLQQVVLPAAGARVVTASTAVTGVLNGGTTVPQVIGTKRGGDLDIVRPSYTHIQKRAYRRAIRRAEQHGTTCYRGRMFTVRQLFGLKRHAPLRNSTTSRTSRSIPRTDTRYSILSWNVGGLTNSLLDELQAWLRLSRTVILR